MRMFLLIPILACMLSCQVGPQKITYGEQACHFCRMTIVDRQHAAQFINDKGKTYNFDAAECLINYLKGVDEEDIGMLLVTDYSRPETLIDATNASFIISEAIPSPMGANLSAVPARNDAVMLLRDKDGAVYNWDELIEHLNK